MWSVLKKKMTKSGGYEMSDRESDSGDDCVVVLKKYTKIPSYAEGLSQETSTTTKRYENPYEIDATQPTDSNETNTAEDQGITLGVDPATTTRVVDDNERDSERTSGDIENNNHDDKEQQGFGARYEQHEDENANGGAGGSGSGGIQVVVSRTLSYLRLEEAAMKVARLSPPRMKRREKQVPGAHPHETSRPPRIARPPPERVNQAEGRYQNLQFDPRRTKKYHAPPPPLPKDFLSSNSEDEAMSRSNSRLPREFPVANNHIYDPPSATESIPGSLNFPSHHPGTVESGYLTLEDVKAQLEQARATNRFLREESDGRSNDSRYDGGSEFTSEAEGRDSEPTSASRFTDVSTSAAAMDNQPKINWKSPMRKLPDTEDGEMTLKPEDNGSDPDESVVGSSMRETGGLQLPDRKSSDRNLSSVDVHQSGRQSIEGGPSSGGSTLSAPETDEKEKKRQEEMVTTNHNSSSLEMMSMSGVNDPGSAMSVEVLHAPDDETAATIPSVYEPTHMSWDELMQEAQILGIPLYRPAASLCRSDSDRRSSMSSSATSSDLSHASPLQSPKTTARLTGNGPWQRKDSSVKRVKDKKSDKKNSPFKGKFKLQNLFAAKKAQTESPKKTTTDRETAQHLNNEAKPDPIPYRADPIPYRAARLREFVRSGLESPVLHHYRSGPPSLRSDRGQNLVMDLSSENGFRNSSISLRSHVLSSSYSSGSLGSVFSRSSSQTPSSSSNSYGKTSASVESPGSSTGTSGSAAILHPTGQSSPPVALQQSVTTSGVGENWFPHVPPSANLSSSGNSDFMIGLRQLKSCGWYWGALGWEEAGMRLTSLPDGSFLVRDSSDDRYILSLSFRSQGLTHHTRIEHYKGVFSFYSQPRSHAASNIVDFIEKAMDQSRSNQYLYFLRPRVAGLPPVPVQLLFPVSRFIPIPSLKHICRSVISSLVPRPDLVDQLPLTSSLRRYIKDSN